jgi:hypothetical protein
MNSLFWTRLIDRHSVSQSLRSRQASNVHTKLQSFIFQPFQNTLRLITPPKKYIFDPISPSPARHTAHLRSRNLSTHKHAHARSCFERNTRMLWGSLQGELSHTWMVYIQYQYMKILSGLRETQTAWISCLLIVSLAPRKKLKKCAGIFKSYGKSPNRGIHGRHYFPVCE